MNSRQLLYAIGGIDEKFIVSAEKRLKDNKEDKKRVFNIIKSVAAAVFAVAVIGAVWVISYKNVITKISPADTAAGNQTDPDPAAALSIAAAAEICLSERSDDNRVFYARDKTSIYRDDLRHIYFCMRVGTDYVMQAMEYGRDYPAGPDGCEISGYQFYYPYGYGLMYIDHIDGGEYYIWDAYNNRKLISDDELKEIYDAYNEFLNVYFKNDETDNGAETSVIIPDDYGLIFDDTEKITDKEKAATLKSIFDDFLNKGINPGYNIKICVKLSDDKYAARLNNVNRIYPEPQDYDTAGGYPILVYDYGMGVPDEKIIVVSGDDIYYGAETAYNEGVINDEEAENIYRECLMHNSSVYYRENTSLLRRSIVEFLNGGTEADKKTGTGSKITYYKYIDIPFCLKLDDEKYALLYHIEGEPTAEFISEEANIKGYKFIYRDGYELMIWNNYMIQGASSASLSDDEVARLYEVYNRYINQ